MREQSIKEWQALVGKKSVESNQEAYSMAIHAHINATKSVFQAVKQIKFTFECQVPAMFVISVVNFKGFSGFRMNSEDYSAHPHEQEYLFMEGARFVVLKVEDVQVKDLQLLQYQHGMARSSIRAVNFGEMDRLSHLAEQTIKIIHLYHF